jgi:hypothetical protein
MHPRHERERPVTPDQRAAVTGQRGRARDTAKPCRSCRHKPDEQNVTATSVIMALAAGCKESFQGLLRSTKAGQSGLAAGSVH